MSDPHDKVRRGSRVRWSTRRIVMFIVLLAILALVIYLKVAGVV
jgi:hypothetical protein